MLGAAACAGNKQVQIHRGKGTGGSRRAKDVKCRLRVVIRSMAADRCHTEEVAWFAHDLVGRV